MPQSDIPYAFSKQLQKELNQIRPYAALGDEVELHGVQWRYVSPPDIRGTPDPETGIPRPIYMWLPIGNADE
jgi:hypothetical protein